MTLMAVLLGAILMVMLGGGICLYRVLVTIMKSLDEINGKMPTAPLLKSLLSI
jgi:hypothetical protein